MENEHVAPEEDVFASLIHIGNVFNTHKDIDQLLNAIAQETVKMLDADRASIFLLDEEKDEIWSKVATGLNKGDVIRMKTSEGIVGNVIKTGQALNIPDAYADPRFNREIDRITGYDTRSIVCFPLTTFSGKIIGAFQVLNKRSGGFTSQDEQILSVLASQATVAIENVQRYQESIKRHETLSSENLHLRKQLSGKYAYPTIVGDSTEIQEVMRAIDKVSTTTANVLITGESGTGKELIARAIHSKSQRQSKAFVALNCASLPEALLESELFGIEKGVATGVAQRSGYLEQADKGTLFLDEVGEMSLPMQAKLLRALQEQTFLRVGGTREISVDVRVIAATNQDFKKVIQEGGFREDLYYRLNVFPIHIPPLRRRQHDIPILARFILSRVVDKMSLGEKTFNRESMEVMQRYHWPGNVRELENSIERAVILSDSPDVDMRPILKDMLGEGADLPEPGAGPSSAAEEHVFFSSGKMEMRDAVKALEVEMIQAALEKTKGNQLKAAQVLGISREGLRKKMARYEMGGEGAESA